MFLYYLKKKTIHPFCRGKLIILGKRNIYSRIGAPEVLHYFFNYRLYSNNRLILLEFQSAIFQICYGH